MSILIMSKLDSIFKLAHRHALNAKRDTKKRKTNTELNEIREDMRCARQINWLHGREVSRMADSLTSRVDELIIYKRHTKYFWRDLERCTDTHFEELAKLP